jgi:hypothetical protein
MIDDFGLEKIDIIAPIRKKVLVGIGKKMLVITRKGIFDFSAVIQNRIENCGIEVTHIPCSLSIRRYKRDIEKKPVGYIYIQKRDGKIECSKWQHGEGVEISEEKSKIESVSSDKIID